MKISLNNLAAIGLISLTLVGCTPKEGKPGADSTNQGSAGTLAAGTFEMDNDDPEISSENVEQRIQENITTIRARVAELNADLKQQQDELSTTALVKSRQLKNDLERLENELGKTMDSIEDASEEMIRRHSAELELQLERAEDEFAQINEELQEWYDKNLN